MKNHKIIVLIAAAGLLSAALPVLAQGTAFTYQGRLNDGASPATGIYDLQFTIYDSTNLPGTVIAGPVTNTATGVSNGLFTVRLDFGAGVFTGPARWLEIGVRTNGGTTFATLAPRQSLTPSPYAIMAGSASNLLGTLPAGQVSGQLSGAQIADGAVTAAKVDNTQVQLRVSGSAPAGQFITAIAANGSVSAAPDTTDWKLNGNTGTTPGANFLGTADNQPLELRVNSLRALRIEPNASGAPNVIAGGAYNYVGVGNIGSTIAGGGSTNRFGVGQSSTNSINGSFGFIGSGEGNSIGTLATDDIIGGGFYNSIGVGTDYGVVAGGSNNRIGPFADYAAIAGGWINEIQNGSEHAAIGGGWINQVQSNSVNATIAGGDNNAILMNAPGSSIGGGENNFIVNFASDGVIGGGYFNVIWTGASCATIGGGSNNATYSAFTFVGGGESNTTVFPHTVIGGGQNNTANGYYAVIGGGSGNRTAEQGAFIGGGDNNLASGFDSVIAGGSANSATATAAFVGGGDANSAGGASSTVGGGELNSTAGAYATVPGGSQNSATGSYSFAAGTRAKAVNTGAFVWADSQNANFASTGTNQFLIRASGGVGINTNNPQSALHVNGTVTAANFSGSMSGLFKSAFATGPVPGTITNGAVADSFVGSTTAGLALAAGQKVLVSVTAMLGTSAASDSFNFSPGYTFNGGAVTETSPFNFMIGTATSAGGRQSYSVTHVFTVPTTGTYVFGFAILNDGLNSLNSNDWMSVSVLAFN